MDHGKKMHFEHQKRILYDAKCLDDWYHFLLWFIIITSWISMGITTIKKCLLIFDENIKKKQNDSYLNYNL
jgi:hypothetical protein